MNATATASSSVPALQLDAVRKVFRRETGEAVVALDDISFLVRQGGLAALVGPDGGGKTTLLRLLAGLMKADGGTVHVLGIDAAQDPQAIQSRISYMPQRFGLYEDLTVLENLDLYSDMHGVSKEERQTQYARLMEMTGLGQFQKRLAGQLSGGMKQKLGLACTLVRSPELLLLDEPTVGVDPLSRHELWEIIRRLIKDGLTVLLSSSDPEEAEACDCVLVLNDGKKLAEAPPKQISALAQNRTFLIQPPTDVKARDFQARILQEPNVVDAVPECAHVRLVSTGSVGSAVFLGVTAQPTPPRFEDGFMVLLHQALAAGQSNKEVAAEEGSAVAANNSMAIIGDNRGGELVVEVSDLVRRFGQFVAVDHVSFSVKRGEIFGLLGPNGAGKTTTFRMLCGLLAASGGTLKVAGVDVRQSRASARQNLGYVAQKFSLYGQLTVAENLDFFARAYGLGGDKKRERVDWAVSQFNLKPFLRLPSAQLPGGFKQRLAMAAALMHSPQILFLDEPTSGADPFARREFWQRITALAAEGVTVIVTTHFLSEAEYCDRALILDGGKVLAQGTPTELRSLAPPAFGRDAGTVTIEDAFIAVVEKARAKTELQHE
ncbi:MAG: ATP-binding cassette domain-containing protein [Burkholderiaceae bacterium]|nr:ATP-binding cassette domain-containing protein [Burkholderiaceae bacterium]